jgi:protein-L-isoaspartate(D-aspartate) O-methyltransferase
MDASLASLADARDNMVDCQLRPNKVNDRRILDAMRRLPRELFVAPGALALAYADVEVPAGQGRFLLAPMVMARLIQAAELPAAAAVLVLGAGYAAAVLAAFGARVTVVEPDAAVLAAARQAIAACGVSVAFEQAPMAGGWPGGAPYDGIFVDGAVRQLPALAGQLRVAPPGRLCAVVAAQGRAGVAIMAEAAGGGLAPRPLFDCTASVLAEFDPPAGFRF